MRGKGEVSGIVSVLSDTKSRRFSLADQELLLQFANQAAIALENARLFGAERLAHERAELFRELTTALSSSLDPGEVLDNILEHLSRVIAYDSACIFLVEGDSLRSVAGRGFAHLEKVIDQDYPLEADDLFLEAAGQDAPLIRADAQSEPSLSVGAKQAMSTAGWASRSGSGVI